MAESKLALQVPSIKNVWLLFLLLLGLGCIFKSLCATCYWYENSGWRFGKYDTVLMHRSIQGETLYMCDQSGVDGRVHVGVKAGTRWPDRWTSEAFETRTRSGTNLFGVFSCVVNFGTTRTLSAPIQHAKSEKLGWWPSEPLDSLIGCVLAVWPFWLAVC